MNSTKVLNLLKWGSFAVLLGRGWQMIFWEVPLRALLWNQNWLSDVLKVFGMTWADYVDDPRLDARINMLVTLWGIFLIVSSLNVMFSKLENSMSRIMHFLSTLSLFFLGFLYFVETQFQWGQWIEYAGQFLIPLLYILFKTKKVSLDSFQFILRIALIGTFLGHGMYALGFYPVPGEFLEMVMESFYLGEDQARLFLRCAGFFDLTLAIVLLFRFENLYRIQYAYLIAATAWGLLTTMARPYSFFYLDQWRDSLLRYFGESLIRAPHFILPIVALVLIKEYKNQSLKQKNKESSEVSSNIQVGELLLQE